MNEENQEKMLDVYASTYAASLTYFLAAHDGDLGKAHRDSDVSAQKATMHFDDFCVNCLK